MKIYMKSMPNQLSEYQNRIKKYYKVTCMFFKFSKCVMMLQSIHNNYCLFRTLLSPAESVSELGGIIASQESEGQFLIFVFSYTYPRSLCGSIGIP